MDYESLIARMDVGTCAALKRAIETGKFPDGRRLSEEQRALCMEAVLAWEMRNVPPEQRTGYIDRGSKAEGEVCDSHEGHDHEQPLTLRGRGSRDTSH